MSTNIRQSLIVGVILLCYAFPSNAQVEIPQTIVYGTVYNIFHDRYSSDQDFFNAVDQDIKGIKDANLNLVMPFPFGQWDAETKQQVWTRTDHLVDKLNQNDLMLMPIMLKSTHRAYLPTWKWLDIPDAIREFPEVSRTTEAVKYMHPEVKDAIDYYFKSVVERYGENSSLVGYDLWNETHYESIDEITLPKYRAWLRDKYGSLKQLNKVWAEDYDSWDQITPLLSRNWESSMAAIDWDLFRYSNNGDLAEWCYNTMRKYDKRHFCAINTVNTLLTNPANDQWNVDGRQISPHTDVFGISFYPDKYMNRHKVAMPYWRYSCVFDVTRSDAGGRPYYLVEAQTNQQNGMGLFQFMSYDDIHLMSWMAFADNCKGIIFWKWKPFYRGQQAFGRGLTMENGALAPRGEAAKEVGSVLKKYGDLIYNADVKQAKAGILYDIVARQKSQEAATRPSSVGTTNHFMNESFEGTYKALFDANLPVDVIRTDMPLDAEQLSKYKILFMPYQLVIRKDIAKMLRTYVQNGGWLVADARTAIMDQFDFGFENNPGYDLDALFAARRLDLYAADSIFNMDVSSTQILDEKLTGKEALKGIYFKEKLDVLDGGEVIANFSEDDDPAIVANQFGKGMAFLSAVPLGGSYYNDIKSAGKLIEALAAKSGVNSSAQVVSSDQSGIMIRVHENAEGEKLVYLINISSQSFTGEVNVFDVEQKPKIITEIISDEEVNFSMEKNKLTVDLTIPAHRSKVLWLH